MGHRKRISKPPTNLAGDSAIGSHAHKRIDRMTLMGLILPRLMAARGIEKTALSHGRATIQAGKGAGQGNQRTQAAHNLPVDLALNGVSIWKYGQEDATLNVDPNIRMQIYYASAATVTVPAIANYVDSRWEESPLPALWIEYLQMCAEHGRRVGQPGSLPPKLRLAAVEFKTDCQTTLASTIARIEASPYYRDRRDELDNVFDIYEERLDRYPPVDRLETMWRIYQRPKYR